MMHWGWGFGGFGMIIWWILIISLVGAIFYGIGNKGRNKERFDNSSENAIEILKERYAKGEITEEEFKKMRKNLQE